MKFRRIQMLSLIFKKCTYRTQMRQFTTVLVCNKDQDKKKVTHYWTELKCTNTINPNLTVHYRSLSTKDEETESKDVTHKSLWSFLTSRFRVIKNTIIIRALIDPHFSLEEFINGAEQAIMVVSQTLASQNYEALDGLVENETIEALKSYLSQMTEQQRLNIAVNDVSLLNIWLYNLDIRKGTTDEDFDYILKIPVLVYYIKEKKILENMIQDLIRVQRPSILNEENIPIMKWHYTFQRKYVGEEVYVGKPWIITNIKRLQ